MQPCNQNATGLHVLRKFGCFPNATGLLLVAFQMQPNTHILDIFRFLMQFGCFWLHLVAFHRSAGFPEIPRFFPWFYLNRSGIISRNDQSEKKVKTGKNPGNFPVVTLQFLSNFSEIFHTWLKKLIIFFLGKSIFRKCYQKYIFLKNIFLKNIFQNINNIWRE